MMRRKRIRSVLLHLLLGLGDHFYKRVQAYSRSLRFQILLLRN